jgi:hypothetical protein
MHASLEQLLTLRQGAADSPAASHVDSCPQCRAEFERLKRTTRALRHLRPRWNVPDRWHAIQRALAEPEFAKLPPQSVAQPRSRPGWLLPAASAALVMVAVLFVINRDNGAGVERTGVSEVVPSAGESNGTTLAHRELINESQRLEGLLQALPSESRITRASTALTVADLQDRLDWVDYRLAVGADGQLDTHQRQRLWRERVDLLNSLVAVRYAEARTVSF